MKGAQTQAVKAFYSIIALDYLVAQDEQVKKLTRELDRVMEMCQLTRCEACGELCKFVDVAFISRRKCPCDGHALGSSRICQTCVPSQREKQVSSIQCQTCSPHISHAICSIHTQVVSCTAEGCAGGLASDTCVPSLCKYCKKHYCKFHMDRGCGGSCINCKLAVTRFKKELKLI